jgi:hypothetical protein
LTREHLVPRFVYSTDIAENSEWFSERYPQKIHRSETVIKDVCAKCNNGALAALDGFGQRLISAVLPRAVFAGDTVQLSCDFNMLLRWVLKICYNSARIHKADIEILSRFAPYILGNTPAPEGVRLAVFAIAPTVYSGARGHITATRQHQDDPTLQIPCCFRISQIRMPIVRTFTSVQRAVIINSCAFIVLAVPQNNANAESQLESIQDELLSLDIGAQIVDLNQSSLLLRSGSENAMTIQRGHVLNNPVTYGAMDGDWIKQRVSGEPGILVFAFCREEIERLEVEPFLGHMRLLLSSRQVSLAVRQRVEFVVLGYDEDPRELWVIPEVRLFFGMLHASFQNWFFLAFPEGVFLSVLANCLCLTPGQDAKSSNLDPERLKQFILGCLEALNHLCHIHAIPDEVNREITEAAIKIITRNLLPEWLAS